MANEVIPEALRRRYIDSFPGKCAAFDAVIEQLNGADVEAAVGFGAKLRDLAHKLAGSAGMYGFDDLGHLAREIVHAIDAGAGTAVLGGLAQNLVERLAGAHAALEI
ncbi:MAG TPA: Hpt domain-containing protein [Xanthomonadales bacterium]|nr:Hpt domain-containing protein [Xanthomonadales bacterium]